MKISAEYRQGSGQGVVPKFTMLYNEKLYILRVEVISEENFNEE